jgi:NADH:ubiquinone oxidoreductase subunit 6 (subunit J)
MIIFWLCCSITLIGAILATFAGDLRVSILALWVAGLGTGGVLLSLGAELLAVVQWIVSTLITLGLLIYGISYGEHGVSDTRPRAQRGVSAILPVLLGLSFSAVIWLGTRHLPAAGVFEPAAGQDLAALGKALLDRHLLSLEVLAVLLFLALVGAGVLARPEEEQK